MASTAHQQRALIALVLMAGLWGLWQADWLADRIDPGRHAVDLESALADTAAIDLQMTDPSAGPALARADNPLWPEYQQLARQWGLDLGFAREVWPQRHKGPLAGFPLFRQAPGSLDVLFVGDSSIAWGLVPAVIEQRTGLRVGTFSFEANVLSARSVRLYEALARCFLKPDGKLVLAFNTAMQAVEPDRYVSAHMRRYEPELAAMHDAIDAGEDLCLQWEARRTAPATADAEAGLPAFSWHFAEYQAFLDGWRWHLARNAGMALPKVRFYDRYLEPRLNPDWHALKTRNEAGDQQFLGWDDESITLFSHDYRAHTWPMTAHYLRPVPIPENLRINAEAVRGLAERVPTLYAVVSSVAVYPAMRSYYQALYQDHLGLLDAPAWLHAQGMVPLPMQFGVHTGNAAGMKQSIAFAALLERFLPQWQQPAVTLKSTQLEPAPQQRLSELLAAPTSGQTLVLALTDAGDGWPKAQLQRWQAAGLSVQALSRDGGYFAVLMPGRVLDRQLPADAAQALQARVAGTDIRLAWGDVPGRPSLRIGGLELATDGGALHAVLLGADGRIHSRHVFSPSQLARDDAVMAQ